MKPFRCPPLSPNFDEGKPTRFSKEKSVAKQHLLYSSCFHFFMHIFSFIIITIVIVIIMIIANKPYIYIYINYHSASPTSEPQNGLQGSARRRWYAG